MKVFIVVIITALNLYGGSYTKVVKERHEFTLNGPAKIVTFTGATLIANRVEIVKDSIHATLLSDSKTMSFARSEIDRIEKSMNNGIRNAVMGGVAGALFSIITASGWNDDDNNGYTFYWSAVLGGLGGGIGYMLGSLQSGEYAFIFEGNSNSYNHKAFP